MCLNGLFFNGVLEFGNLNAASSAPLGGTGDYYVRYNVFEISLFLGVLKKTRPFYFSSLWNAVYI